MFAIIFALFILISPPSVLAATTHTLIESKVISIEGETHVSSPNSSGEIYQNLLVELDEGVSKGNRIKIQSPNLKEQGSYRLRVGDRIYIGETADPEGGKLYQFSDYIRRTPLLILAIIFTLLTLLIARLRGLTSLFGMIISFAVILKFMLPQIYQGANPILVALMGSLIIIPVTFFLSHGVNKKTIVAILGTLLSLTITVLLASIFISYAKLTGFASEEAGFLNVFRQGQINIRDLLLSGIIIGVLGVLDDITVSQSAIVEELHRTDSKLNAVELYKRSMKIGRDHISSMVNTLILVYAGASLPLLLLFVDANSKVLAVINFEIVAEEIIRTLVGSIGLILAVPITTYLASLAVTINKKL